MNIDLTHVPMADRHWVESKYFKLVIIGVFVGCVRGTSRLIIIAVDIRMCTRYKSFDYHCYRYSLFISGLLVGCVLGTSRLIITAIDIRSLLVVCWSDVY